MRISDWSSDVCSSDLAGFGKSVLMVADIVEIERLFLAVLAQTGRDDADVGLALGGLAQARRFGEHGFQKLQRNDFATFVDHRVDARHADVLEHGEVLDIGLAKGHPETDAPD